MISLDLQQAPAAFQNYVNEISGDYLDTFCTTFIDEVLIYITRDLLDHWSKIEAVFKRLERSELKLDSKKCKFAV